MTHIFIAIRSAVYAAGFVLLWGWLATSVRATLGEWFVLPLESRFFGVGSIIIGGPIVFWCLIQFLVVGKGTAAPFDAPAVFVASGPYRYVRNPMYLGAALVLFGYGLWNRSTTIALFSFVFILSAHVFVRVYEEPTLERRFGLSYRDYKATVQRWLPKKPAEETPNS